MSDEIPTGLAFVDAPPAPSKFNVVLYGPAKSGKSTAAATAEGPILWVNLEGPGALGFARKRAAERGVRIHEARIGKDDDPRPVLREVLRHIRTGEEPRPRTVVIDTVGKLREGLARKIVEKNSRNSLGQWGEVGDIIKEIVGALRDEPLNLILLCHEDVTEGEGDEPRIVRPLIGGKVTAYVLGEVDVIGYCGAVQGEYGIRYVAQLVEGKGRVAGDRSGGLGAVRDLDLSEWWATYRDALTPADDLPWDDTEPPSQRDSDPALPVGDAPAAELTPLPVGAAPIDAELKRPSDDEIAQALVDELGGRVLPPEPTRKARRARTQKENAQ